MTAATTTRAPANDTRGGRASRDITPMTAPLSRVLRLFSPLRLRPSMYFCIVFSAMCYASVTVERSPMMSPLASLLPAARADPPPPPPPSPIRGLRRSASHCLNFATVGADRIANVGYVCHELYTEINLHAVGVIFCNALRSIFFWWKMLTSV